MSSVYIQPALDRPAAGTTWPLARRLVAHAGRFAPRQVAALLALGALHSILEGASIVLLLPVLASLGIGNAGGTVITGVVRSALAAIGLPYTLATTLALVFVVGAVTAIVDLLHTFLADSTERRLASHMQLEVYQALAASASPTLSRQRIGHTTAVLTKFADQAAIAFVRLSRVVTGSMAGLVLVLVALSQAWQFVVVTFAALAVASWPILRASRTTYRHVLEAQSQVRRLWVLLADELRLLPTIKAFGAESQSVGKIRDEVLRAERLLLGIKRRIAFVRSSLQPGLLGLLCLAIYLGATVFTVPLERLLLLVGVFVRLMPTIVRIMAEGQDLPILFVAHDEVERFVEACRSTAEHKGGEEPPDRLRAGLALRNIQVTDGASVILDTLSLEVAPGSLTALVGESGAGKTTVAAAILGLANVTGGSVEIDGRDIRRLDLREWRRRIGYVSQDVVVFGGTIRENLRFAVPEADEAAMWAALEDASVAEFVRSLPSGLDTFIGEGGSLISGGERQRIAIARALLRDPLLLVLDEATSALDAETTQLLIATLERLRHGRTVLVIAHDLDVVRSADVIYVLDKGRVIERGSWVDLVERQGQLFKLAVLQRQV